MKNDREQKPESAVAFVVRQSANEKLTCQHCGKYGHDKAGRFELIDCPTSWGSRGRGRGDRDGARGGKGGRGGVGRGAPTAGKEARRTDSQSLFVGAS